MQLARPNDDFLETLLQKFVCVRMVQGNGADLSLFQFDYDLTFAAFFMNADKTIYGRFSSRSASGPEHVTTGALLEAMQGALRLHKGYPGNRELLKKKNGSPPVAKKPAEIGILRRYDEFLDFENGNSAVGGGCIHCHNLGTGIAHETWAQKKPLTDKMLFPWPMPDQVGMRMTVDDDTLVDDVQPGSAAAKAGLQPGDRLLRFDGQPLLSLADVQWVLHEADGAAELPILVQRDLARVATKLVLDARWRRPSARTWRMRGGHGSLAAIPPLVMGSVQLREISASRRKDLGLAEGALALESGDGRAFGRRRGGRGGRGRGPGGRGGSNGGAKPPTFAPGDVIVAFDGITTHMTDVDVMAHLFQKHVRGDQVPVVVLRDGNRVERIWQL